MSILGVHFGAFDQAAVPILNEVGKRDAYTCLSSSGALEPAGLKSKTRVISNERRRNERRGEEKTFKTSIKGMQGKTLKVSPRLPTPKA